MQQWLLHIKRYRLPIFFEAIQRVPLKGRGVEIGAGSAWLSTMLSQQPAIDHITAVEIDPERLRQAEDFFLPALGGHREKISYHAGDFHQLPFPDASLDFVVCDAALHHTEHLERLLAEVRRILRPGGTLLAIREPVLPSFLPLRWWRSWTFGWHQRRHGDIEKTYRLDQWQTAFERLGFSFTPYPAFAPTTVKEKMVKALGRWNGILFGRYFFVGQLTARPSLL